MSVVQRVVLWSFIGAFTIACVWWALYVPYRPDDLFRPIPSNATFLSRHRDLAKRWDEMYANPLVLSVFLSAGVRPATLKAWADDPETREWFNRLAGRDTVLAYVPPRVSHGEPTWIVTSWLGGRSQRLRWQLVWRRSKELVRITSRHGHSCWTVHASDIAPGAVLTFALVEGLLIGCLSDSERTLFDLLDTYDGLRPSIRPFLRDPTFKPGVSTGAVPDAAWMRFDFPGVHGPYSRSLGLEFPEISATAFVCRAYLPKVGAPRITREADLTALAAVLGDAPVGMVGLPLAWLPEVSRGRTGAWQQAARHLANQQQAEWGVLALLSSAYQGRVAGLRFPAVVAALPLTAPDRADTQMREALDFINSRLRLGLIPYPWQVAQVGGTSETAIVVLEATGQKFYSTLPPEGKPAYAVVGNWLLLASQAGILTQLLARAGSIDPCLQKAMGPPPFWVWGDFRSGGDALRLALSAYSFKLLMEDAVGSSRRRQRINEWRAWLDALEPLEQCAAQASPWSIPYAGGPMETGLILTVKMGRLCP